jgi:hypothetical protein
VEPAPIQPDSQEAAELASSLADAEMILTPMLDQLTREELNRIDLALIEIDPTGVVAWEFRGVCPARKSPRNPGI